MFEVLKDMRIGCAMTGSFCTFAKVFAAWRALGETGANLTPILSPCSAASDTRFFPAEEVVRTLREITGKNPLVTLNEVEPIGPKKLLDLLIIAPCTGNTLGKLACGISDTPVLMAAKSHLRNGRPVLLAVSTNDGLGRSAESIGKLLAMKHIFFVPFGQDDCKGKPDSLVADFNRLTAAAAEAIFERQIQPVFCQNMYS